MTTGTQSRADQIRRIQRRYPSTDRLRGGRELILRLMTESDRTAWLSFARRLPPDDLLYMRWDVADERAVDQWLANIALGRTLTVLALEGTEIVGEASLTHNETDWTRHIGDIRIVVGPQVRGEGLGRFLAEEIFVLAELLGLLRLTAQMAHDQERAQAVFRGLGFEPVALLPGFVMRRDAVLRDLVVMAYDVRAHGAPTSETSKQTEA